MHCILVLYIKQHSTDRLSETVELQELTAHHFLIAGRFLFALNNSRDRLISLSVCVPQFACTNIGLLTESLWIVTKVGKKLPGRWDPEWTSYPVQYLLTGIWSLHWSCTVISGAL